MCAWPFYTECTLQWQINPWENQFFNLLLIELIFSKRPTNPLGRLLNVHSGPVDVQKGRSMDV